QVANEILDRFDRERSGVFYAIRAFSEGDVSIIGSWAVRKAEFSWPFTEVFRADLFNDSDGWHCSIVRNGHFLVTRLKDARGVTEEWVFEKQPDLPAGLFLNAKSEGDLERLAGGAF